VIKAENDWRDGTGGLKWLCIATCTFPSLKFISDWGEAFRLFDVDNAGFIDARKLFNVIRLLGYNPTEAEVQDLIAAGDKDGVPLRN